MQIKSIGVGNCPKCNTSANLWQFQDDTKDYINYEYLCSECFLTVAKGEDVWMTFKKMYMKGRD